MARLAAACGDDSLARFLARQLCEACDAIEEGRAALLVAALMAYCAEAPAAHSASGSAAAPATSHAPAALSAAAAAAGGASAEACDGAAEQEQEEDEEEGDDDGSAAAHEAMVAARRRTQRLGDVLVAELKRQAPAWALEGSELEVRAALAELVARRAAAKEAFAVMHGVHASLRSRGAAVPSDAELEAYARSTLQVAAKSWSSDSQRWVLDELGLLGAVAGAAAPASPASPPPPLAGETRRPVRLLDVGSSFGAFCGVDGVQCVAFDLAPATPTVLRADFLELPISTDLGEDVRIEGSNLLAVGAGSFDVVVMSLVLSFVPLPAHRRAMLDKARCCLRPSGSLFVIEKAALASGGRAAGRGQLDAFREGLEAAGFVARRYAALGRLEGGRKPHAHAWRLVPEAEPRPHPGPWLREDVLPEAAATAEGGG
mmetsp:Transcript_159600/g.512136  ORF Transcript_159600/g.512136 Transcript_159600/m.512136 type:complete len:430 (+) Transcript_159600:80-1369(+)